MASGLYLYCLRESQAAAPPVNAAAVDGLGRVTIRACDGVEAVVSDLDLEDCQPMRKKAREDIQWIRQAALAHEKVVEQAMGPAATPALVIPIKFGVIFNTEARLVQVIGQQHAAINACFDRVRGKQEWGVKLFLQDQQNFQNQVTRQSNTLREKSKQLAALPAGIAYFMEQELQEAIDDECRQRLTEEGWRTFEYLRLFAAEATRMKILDGQLTGRREPMALNAACLVALARFPAFAEALARLRGGLEQKGILLEQSGPWPAYNFTEFAHD